MLSTFLVTVDNIKSYLNANQNFFHFVNGLEQIMPSYINNPYQHWDKTFKYCFATHILYAYHQETFRTRLEVPHIFGLNVYANAFLCIRYMKLRSWSVLVVLITTESRANPVLVL